jgi:hypothetical protein
MEPKPDGPDFWPKPDRPDFKPVRPEKRVKKKVL